MEGLREEGLYARRQPLTELLKHFREKERQVQRSIGGTKFGEL